MISNLKRNIARHLTNIPGWWTDRKIVAFESDDWGSIRMPSIQSYEKLLSKGIRVDQSYYDRFDILENRRDLNALFEVLVKYKDTNRNQPIFTFNTVMGNPDFKKIKSDNFQHYHFEHLFESYKKYHQDDLSDLWFQAIDSHLIRPQFHAREHLNVALWMEALQKDHELTRLAFNYRFYGLKTQTPSPNQKNYLAAYWAEDEKDFKSKAEIVKEGLQLFESTFGFQSMSFIACNYIYPKELEKCLFDFGVKYIQGQRGHLSPCIQTGSKKIHRHYTGQKNNLTQRYLVRNCTFEPSSDWNKNWVDSCLKDIQSAFKWNKPAIISTHRVNYVGGLSEKNRDRGLDNLDFLVSSILQKWPDIEFLSTDELGKIMETDS